MSKRRQASIPKRRQASIPFDLIGAQRDFQVAEALEDADAAVDKQVAVADAQYDLAVGRADAELAWRFAAAPSLGSFVDHRAETGRGLTADLSGNGTDYSNSLATESLTMLDADASAESDFWADTSLAASDFESATAATRSAFLEAEHDADVVAMGNFATEMGSPWAQFKADQAVAHRDWWDTQKQTFLDWYTNVASQQSAYQTLVSAASTVWNTALSAADSTYVAALANAAETHAGSTAQAERDFVGSVADAYETYQTQAAQALRDQQVALAGAQRDLDAGGSQSAYDAAVAAANAATIKSAADQLAATMAAAEGQQQLATAQAALVRAQTVGPANVTWVTAYSAADLTHVNSRTDAYVTSATDLANDISDYATQEAASLATAISDFATLHTSPWATYDSARTSALHAQVVATAPALATRDIAIMTAQAAAEVAIVEAQNDYYEAVAQADRDESIDTAQAAVDRATTSKQATDAMVAATGQAGAQQAQGESDSLWAHITTGILQQVITPGTNSNTPAATVEPYSTGNSQSSAAPGVTSMTDFTAGAGQMVQQNQTRQPVRTAPRTIGRDITRDMYQENPAMRADLEARHAAYMRGKAIGEEGQRTFADLGGFTVFVDGAEAIGGKNVLSTEGEQLTPWQRVKSAFFAGLSLIPLLGHADDGARAIKAASRNFDNGVEVARHSRKAMRSAKTVASHVPWSGILGRIGNANLPYRTPVTWRVKLSRFFATRTGYQQVIKHSPITKWLQSKGWQSHHWFIARSKGLAGSEGLRRITEAGWNLIPLPARLNRVIGNGGLGFNATRLLVGASPGIAFYGGYEFGSFVIDVGWWLTGGEPADE